MGPLQRLRAGRGLLLFGSFALDSVKCILSLLPPTDKTTEQRTYLLLLLLLAEEERGGGEEALRDLQRPAMHLFLCLFCFVCRIV